MSEHIIRPGWSRWDTLFDGRCRVVALSAEPETPPAERRVMRCVSDLINIRWAATSSHSGNYPSREVVSCWPTIGTSV